MIFLLLVCNFFVVEVGLVTDCQRVVMFIANLATNVFQADQQRYDTT